MKEQGKWISGALFGAGLMYLLDPDRGTRRRALLRDRAARASHKLGDGMDATARDLRNRAKGTAAELRSRLRREVVSDEVLHERVRAAIGRAVLHPSAITVTVREGEVTLQGTVLGHEVPTLLRAANRVRGVAEVVNQLEVYGEPGTVPSLQGGGRPREPRAELRQENWAPATRLLMGALGGMLALRGLRGRGPLNRLAATTGAGMLARAIGNMPAKRLTGVGASRRVIDVQKVITVAAPVEPVWELWSNFENFPRFMEHLKEVRRSGEGRSHWVAAGPAGTTVEWDAVTTESVPNELIAWKSVEGSTVGNAGIVRFQPTRDGGTRIDVRLSYNPPGGAIGHAVASFFGVDPQRALTDDMVRLKSLLEEGKTTADQGTVSLDEVSAGPPDATR